MATVYPSIATLIGETQLPSVLGAPQATVAGWLNDLRYSALIVERSSDNSAAYYGLTLVAEELGVDLLGSGLKLIFFPADPIPAPTPTPTPTPAPTPTPTPTPAPTTSEIAIDFSYRWPILRYIPAFETLGFAADAQAFFKLLLELVDLTTEEFLAGIVEALIDDPAPYQALIDQLALWQPPAGPILANRPPGYSEIEYIAAYVDDLQAVDIFTVAFDKIVKDASDPEASVARVVALFRSWLGDVTRAEIEALLLPRFALELEQIKLALEAPRTALVPIDAAGKDTGGTWRASFTAGAVRYDSHAGFDIAVDKALTVDFPRAAIPGFGLTLAFHDVDVDLSRDSNIAAADAEGRPPDFMGVSVGSAVIGLPPEWFEADAGATLAVVGRYMLIGTGGFSGKIKLEVLASGAVPAATPSAPAIGATLKFTLGRKRASAARTGFGIAFSRFDMTFRQNVLLESCLACALTVPKLSADPIEVELYLTGDGDFEGTAILDAKGHVFTVLDVFTFTARSVALGKSGERVFLRTSGDLSFVNNSVLGKLIKSPIHIEKLLIDSAGEIAIEGGSIPLPESVLLPLGPAKLAITAIHFGKTRQPHGGAMRDYAYWGFDGGIDVSPGGLDCRGTGVKFYYTTDDDKPAGRLHHHFLRIEGIEIDLVIPFGASEADAAMLIQGWLALKTDVYEGGVAFQIPGARIAGGAAMKYDTRDPSWLVQVSLELPKPLPLGSTSLGIYGFNGLFGWHWVASKAKALGTAVTEDSTWGDFYRAPQVGVDRTKFDEPDETKGASNPFSAGAGVSLATLADDGKAFTSQLFLLVQVPPLIILDGKFDVMADKRLGLKGGDPPFYAFITLSEESIQIGAGANYRVPRESGKILKLNATLDSAYFFRNASAWYINLGTRDQPATARVIELFDAYAYLMLSASGIEAGTGVSYDFNKNYGPIAVSAHAYLDLWGYVSFERMRAGGGIALGGYVDIHVYGFGLQISLSTALTVEMAKPFKIAGYVELCVTVDLKLTTFHQCVDVHFVWERDTNVDLAPVELIQADASKAPASAVHMVSGATYPVEISQSATPGAAHYIPIDCFIDIKLAKPVKPGADTALIGGYTSAPSGESEALPPRYAARAVEHAYSLELLKLEVRKPGGTWTDYHPYQALAGEASDGTVPVPSLTDLPIGFWQRQDPGYSQIRLLGLTPFSFMQPAIAYRPEEWGVTPRSIYCVTELRQERCATWIKPPKKYPAGTGGTINGMAFLAEGAQAAEVALADPRLGPTALGLKPGGRVTLTFIEAVVKCRIVAGTEAPQLVIRFQRRKPVSTGTSAISIPWPGANPDYEDQEVRTVSRADLMNPVKYDQPGKPIERIVIEPPVPDFALIAGLKNDLESLTYQWFFSAPADRPAIDAKMQKIRAQLAAEHARTCVGGLAGGGATGVKDQIAALATQLAAAKEELAKMQARYNRFCGLNEGCLAAIVKPVARLMGRAPPRPQALMLPPPDPTPSPTPPPVQQIDCVAMAAEIASIERWIADLQAQIDALTASQESANNGFPAEWGCGTFVHEVCWMTLKDWAYNQSVPGLAAIEADYSAMRDAINHMVAPVWRPEQTYRITLKVRDTVYPKGGPEHEWDQPFYVHFKTDGPLGHVAKYQPPALFNQTIDPDLPSDGRHDAPEFSLKYYLDDRSLPNPLGDLTRAKPVYYADVVIDLYFTKPYAYHFFADWPDPYGLGPAHYALELQVLDPAMAKPLPGALPRTRPDVDAPRIGQQSWIEFSDWQAWAQALVPPPSPEITTIDAYSDPQAATSTTTLCLSKGGDPIRPRVLALRTELGDLEPDKLYTAVVLNKRLHGVPKEAEVHRFPFFTSLYRDFDEHIGSCKLIDAAGNTRIAAFTLSHTLAAGARARALAVITQGSGAATHADAYPDPFDRLIHGWLKLPALAPPAGVEFTFVTDSATSKTYGIWMRNREAINDPRAPAASAAAAIALKQGGNPVAGVKVLVSKDGCEAFLMAASGSLPTTHVSVAFSRLRWNGAAYAVAGSPVITPAFDKP